MNENNIRIEFYRMITKEDPMRKIKTLFEKALKSEVIEPKNESAGSFRLPYIIYHAILVELCNSVKPQNEHDLIESENLQRFLGE